MALSPGPRKRLKKSEVGSKASSSSSSTGLKVNSCVLCRCDDTHVDLLIKTETMFWAYRKTIRGQTVSDGTVCYYCNIIYHARYHHKYTVASLAQSMGEDQSLHKTFFELRSFVVAKMVDAGKREVRIVWDQQAPTQRVKRCTDKILSLEAPEDQLVEEASYIRLHGDWRTNNKGHRRATIDGVTGVLIPGARVWRVRRKKELRATHEEDMTSPDLELPADMLEEMQDEILSGFLPGTATGESRLTLDELLARNSSPSSEGPTPQRTSAMVEHFSPRRIARGFSLTFDEADAAPNAAAKAKARGTPKKKAVGEGASKLSKTGTGPGRPKRCLFSVGNQAADTLEHLHSDSAGCFRFGPHATCALLYTLGERHDGPNQRKH